MWLEALKEQFTPPQEKKNSAIIYSSTSFVVQQNISAEADGDFGLWKPRDPRFVWKDIIYSLNMWLSRSFSLA